MMKEELEKRLHNIAELLYEQGFDDGKAKGFEDAQQLKMSGMYEQGLEDAWECIQKICMEEPFGLTTEQLEKIFNSRDISSVVTENTVQEAMQKIKGYEERQKHDATDINDGSIKVGDEVRIKGSDPVKDDCDYGICTRSLPNINTIYVMRRDGSSSEENKDEWYRTGRHFNAIDEILSELKNEKN